MNAESHKTCNIQQTSFNVSHITVTQGRNFGLKSGVQIQKENDEAPLGSETSGEENGEEVFPSSSDSGIWESVMSSLSGVRGGAPAENGFIVTYFPQIASVDSR